MLKAFIDDSYMGRPPVYVLAGWCGAAPAMAPFSDAWRDICHFGRRIEYFKFSEAWNLDGEFDGATEPQRREKINLLIRTIADHKLAGFTAIIPHNNFHPLFGHRSHWRRDAYFLAFYMIVSRLLMYYGPKGVKEKIDFLFDYQPGSNQMEIVRSAWDFFIETVPTEALPMLNRYPPNFFDDRKVVALQAADLLAGWVRVENEAKLLGREPPAPLWDYLDDVSLPIHHFVFNSKLAESLHKRIYGFEPLRITYHFGHWFDPSPPDPLFS